MKFKTPILIIVLIHTISSCSTVGHTKASGSSIIVQDENVAIEANQKPSQIPEVNKRDNQSEKVDISKKNKANEIATVSGSVIGLILGFALLAALTGL